MKYLNKRERLVSITSPRILYRALDKPTKFFFSRDRFSQALVEIESTKISNVLSKRKIGVDIFHPLITKNMLM